MIFDKSDAKKYAEQVRREQSEQISVKAETIYQYVLGVYEQKIKKELDRNPHKRLVEIYIPRKYRKVKRSELKLANDYLSEKFREMKFEVTLVIHSCCICPLQFLGCEDQYYMIIQW